MIRFAFYGRLSTDDKQDQTLARPSQLEACKRQAGELGGEVLAEFFDQESGARDDRPGWTALTQEARERTTRRFDAVIIYQTSRLARDRFLAAMYERELRKVGVPIHYATGAGDPTTPEGSMMIGIQQLFDEFERKKLSRETKRGMRQTALQGFRCGGRAPYGYQLERSPHPVPARAKGGETKSRLAPDPDQAPVIAEIFHLWADKGWGCKAIADHLNRPGGPPSPNHVDTSRNVRGDWAKSSLRAILKNPTYTGRIVWNRLDFAAQREAGGTARLRPQEEWVIADVEHEALISDELFAAAQAGFEKRSRKTSGPRNGRSPYLLAGMVSCASGHQPLAMYGRRRKDHVYMTCDYGRAYGNEAADQIDGHGRWLYLREDNLLPLIETFFAERIFGPMRIDKLEQQLRTHERSTRHTEDGSRTRITKELASLDDRIGKLIDALENGLDAEQIRRRLATLQKAKEKAEIELRTLTPTPADLDSPGAIELLSRVPDLSQAMRCGTPEMKRQLFEAFGLQITYDRARNHISIAAVIAEQLAQAIETTGPCPDPPRANRHVKADHEPSIRLISSIAPPTRFRTHTPTQRTA